MQLIKHLTSPDCMAHLTNTNGYSRAHQTILTCSFIDMKVMKQISTQLFTHAMSRSETPDCVLRVIFLEGAQLHHALLLQFMHSMACIAQMCPFVALLTAECNGSTESR